MFVEHESFMFRKDKFYNTNIGMILIIRGEEELDEEEPEEEEQEEQ